MGEESKHRIKKACRAELKFELLQKHSNIKLDPILNDACGSDIEKFCVNERADDGGLECLKSLKHRELSKRCRKELFKEEMEEAVDNDTDFAPKCLAIIGKRIVQHSKDFRLNPSLRKSCNRDIPKFCKEVMKFKGEDFFEGQVIECLKEKAIQKHSKLTDQCRKEILTIISYSAHIVDADPVLEEKCPH